FNVRRAGLQAVAKELGISLAEFDKGEIVPHHDALLNKRFLIARGVLAADGLVSLPKLKAHGLMRFTGAVKNQFGCVPGLEKSQHHLRMPDPYDFAAMLVDLNTLLKPRLFIMDGIAAMEGNGPRSGKLRNLGALLFSSDPVALDAVACRLINLEPVFVPTAAAGERAGLGTYRAENIEVVGDRVEKLVIADFDVPRQPPGCATGGRLRSFLKNRLCPRPMIDASRCNRCGTCVQVCPVTPKAVDWRGGEKTGPPAYDYDRCIRCFCCQELCPEGAISVRETLPGRVFR
ncbi:MAG: DUF362 domain-containing protein, partial [Chloroflexota bacterium]